MKKEYTNPIIEVLSLDKEDVVTTSGTLGTGTLPGYGDDPGLLG